MKDQLWKRSYKVIYSRLRRLGSDRMYIMLDACRTEAQRRVIRAALISHEARWLYGIGNMFYEWINRDAREAFIVARHDLATLERKHEAQHGREQYK